MALTVLSNTFTKVGRVVYVCFLVTVLKKKKKGSFSLHNHRWLCLLIWKHSYRPLQVFEISLSSLIHYPTPLSTPGKIPYLYILKSAIWYYYLCLSDCIVDNHDIKKKTHTA